MALWVAEASAYGHTDSGLPRRFPASVLLELLYGPGQGSFLAPQSIPPA